MVAAKGKWVTSGKKIEIYKYRITDTGLAKIEIETPSEGR